MAQLDAFFQPQSIAIIGASESEDSMGGLVMQNLLQAGFKGELFAVNRKDYQQVYGKPVYKSIKLLAEPVDLAVICIPTNGILRALKEIADHGCRAAMILTGGASRRLSEGALFVEKLNQYATSLGIRLLGPNCMGIMVPPAGLNASFAHVQPLSGRLAFVGQSVSIGSSLLDWATSQGVGFSHFVTVGERADINASDVIDYLARDRRVNALLLHIESIRNARRFMTVLRAASRTRKVLAIKTASNEVAPAGLPNRQGLDKAFFERAGVLLVDSFDGLFSGVETLMRAKPLYGHTLAIVSNGLGPAKLAEQWLKQNGGQLADLGELQQELGDTLWYSDETQGNPLILQANASSQEILSILKRLDKMQNLGGILWVHTPNKRSPSDSLAAALAPGVKRLYHSVLGCWLGGEAASHARQSFQQQGLLAYSSPNDAVDAWLTMAQHDSNQQLLRQTPSTMELGVQAERETVKHLLKGAQREERDYLTWLEARRVLQCYGLQPVSSQFFADAASLLEAIPSLQYPVALRLVHTQACIPFSYAHDPIKRWRAVAIEIKTASQLMDAYSRLNSEREQRYPKSSTLGYVIQPMVRRLDSLQFSMGVTRDPVYGPLIIFGEGGAAADIMADRRFAFPPLNSRLAEQLVESSHVWELLCERSLQPEQDKERLIHALMTLSQLVLDQPRIAGVEINCLLQAKEGLLVLGAAISLGEEMLPVVSPYPQQLSEGLQLGEQFLLLRAIRAEDEPMLERFFLSMSEEELRFRFFGSRLRFRHQELAAMCQIDYEREMAFVAVTQEQRLVAEVRTHYDLLVNQLEFSIMVAKEYQGTGLAMAMMQKIIRYGKGLGVQAVVAEVMTGNQPMLALARKLGFSVHNEEDMVRLHLQMATDTSAAEGQA